MKDKVVGIFLNGDGTKVISIKNQIDEWKHEFTGIEGDVLETDSIAGLGMCRAFEEKTGLKTFYYDWTPLACVTDLKNEIQTRYFVSSKVSNKDAIFNNIIETDITYVIDVEYFIGQLTDNHLKWFMPIMVEYYNGSIETPHIDIIIKK